MSADKPPLLIPSETQNREFDPKLLLACLAAERGYRSIVGARVEMHKRITALPVGVYLAKDVFHSSCKMFQILRGLGHRIVAWDEEGLLFATLELYLRRRAAACTVSRIDRFFTWGEADREMLAPAELFARTAMVASGNPRMDLMRPELRAFFAPDVARLRAEHGRFILVNTNFGRLNHFLAAKNLTPSAPGGEAVKNRQPNDLPLATWLHRERIFKHFKQMLPALAAALPETRIVLRPHPSENRATWSELARPFANVVIVHEGYVAPWLLAADVLVHNGCMTGLEAFLLDAPAIAYEPELGDNRGWELPNRLSYSARDLPALIGQVRAIVADPGHAARKSASDPQARALAQRHVANMSGKLAGERILDEIEAMLGGGIHPAPSTGPERRVAWREAQLRSLAKRLKSLWPNHKNSKAYSRHRFAGVSDQELRAKIASLAAITGRFAGVRGRRLFGDIFEISPAADKA